MKEVELSELIAEVFSSSSPDCICLRTKTSDTCHLPYITKFSEQFSELTAHFGVNCGLHLYNSRVTSLEVQTLHEIYVLI